MIRPFVLDQTGATKLNFQSLDKGKRLESFRCLVMMDIQTKYSSWLVIPIDPLGCIVNCTGPSHVAGGIYSFNDWIQGLKQIHIWQGLNDYSRLLLTRVQPPSQYKAYLCSSRDSGSTICWTLNLHSREGVENQRVALEVTLSLFGVGHFYKAFIVWRH